MDLPVSWLLILLGAEIAHAFQNLSLLEAEERRQHGKEPINALVATQLLAAVAAHHERGGPGISRGPAGQGLRRCPPTWWAASSSA